MRMESHKNAHKGTNKTTANSADSTCSLQADGTKGGCGMRGSSLRRFSLFSAVSRPLSALLVAFSLSAASGQAQAERPNVVFLVVDDLNDWVGALGHGQAKTPNIDRLAEQGTLFANAHSPAPICNPSRTAIMLGRYPHKTGIYDNRAYWRLAFPEAVTLPEHFRRNGYLTAGGGKLFHTAPGYNDPRGFDSYFFWNPKSQYAGWGEHYHHPDWPGLESKPASVMPTFTKQNFDYAILDHPEEDMPDNLVAQWAADFLSEEQEEPFFMAAGMFRPHLEWYAPRKYFEMYPLEDIELPPYLATDLEDVGEWARSNARDSGSRHAEIVARGEWKKLVQAYLACISYADANVGRIMNALDAGPNRENTIVVLWSDHGYHLGEKDHWRKFTLWERSTRVPLIFRLPGRTQAGSRVDAGVGLISLYRTLSELAGLPVSEGVDGPSLVPLLENPQADWEEPALTTHGEGNAALRDERWRYIMNRDGAEELYDHQSDPNEWRNLAQDPRYQDVLAKFRKQVPSFVPKLDNKGVFDFNYEGYYWTHPQSGQVILGR